MKTYGNYNELSMGPVQRDNVDFVWAVCRNQLDRGSTEVVVTAEGFDSIGPDGLKVIADRFR